MILLSFRILVIAHHTQRFIFFMETKICKTCGIEKQKTEFYKHSQTRDRVYPDCKPCSNEICKRKLAIKWQSDPDYRERLTVKNREKGLNKICSKNYREKYPEKKRAAWHVAKFKKEGFHQHHWSYNKEHLKDAFYVTQSNHSKIHKTIRYDQSVFMYRDLEGNLLDSREKHEAHIKQYLPIINL